MADVSTESPGVRDRILDAAEVVVAREGVAKLTLEAVSREAGVSKGGLLYHYPSKTALITAIVERIGTRCDGDQARLDPPDAEPGAYTRAYVSVRCEAGCHSTTPQERSLKAALLAAAGTDPQLLDPMRKRMASWQERLRDDGIDATTAAIVRLAVDGLGLCRMLGLPAPEGAELDAVVERLLAMTREPAASRSNGSASNGSARSNGTH